MWSLVLFTETFLDKEAHRLALLLHDKMRRSHIAQALECIVSHVSHASNASSECTKSLLDSSTKRERILLIALLAYRLLIPISRIDVQHQAGSEKVIPLESVNIPSREVAVYVCDKWRTKCNVNHDCTMCAWLARARKIVEYSPLSTLSIVVARGFDKTLNCKQIIKWTHIESNRNKSSPHIHSQAASEFHMNLVGKSDQSWARALLDAGCGAYIMPIHANHTPMRSGRFKRCRAESSNDPNRKHAIRSSQLLIGIGMSGSFGYRHISFSTLFEWMSSFGRLQLSNDSSDKYHIRVARTCVQQ